MRRYRCAFNAAHTYPTAKEEQNSAAQPPYHLPRPPRCTRMQITPRAQPDRQPAITTNKLSPTTTTLKKDTPRTKMAYIYSLIVQTSINTALRSTRLARTEYSGPVGKSPGVQVMFGTVRK
ncbi:hypothetical protein P280DRAFT_471520 [Massarina eburnea CBS 473.64]|uniref:Uncharacterized protein n=1 Tax=Massarina eburnea CBS 473.64 TaxID=1395130 RepID=A0A6A6RWT3_9PLEO|nr:hypothetical protein P280DRAFT_471520 [Massarina eburnea CBS 473.64]